MTDGTAPATERDTQSDTFATTDGVPKRDVWLSRVTAGYGDKAAIEDVDLAVAAGTLLAVVGPNGAGKSTLLKVMAGLLVPWSGTVEILGAPATQEAHHVAYVPQAETVDWAFPVTVADVVMMGRYPLIGPLRRPGLQDQQHVDEALELVGMAQHRMTQIGRLSGGQRRRVFLARAIAADPTLYLLDEPVTGIDATTQEDLMEILNAEAGRGRTVIATTHDLASAAEHFHRVAAINRTVVAEGPARIILDPDVLKRTYGGHLLVLDSQTVVLDDAHHHDERGETETHYHEETSRH
jgi:ABC-type Mn2+/Zn2+ transport system ATPase subunit